MTLCPIRFLCAAEALIYTATATTWFIAWRTPGSATLSRAAFWTGFCFLLKAFRLSLAIVVGI